MSGQRQTTAGRALLTGLLSGAFIMLAAPASAAGPAGAPAMSGLIPWPVSVKPADGAFEISAGTSVYVQPGSVEIMAIGRYLADRLRPATGFPLNVLAAEGTPPGGAILLALGGDQSLGPEGYELTVAPGLITLTACQPAGLFRGVQTIRQLLPAAVESSSVQAGPWNIPAGTIRDYPRFAWRGVMLDVARHFFPVGDVERYIDLLAYYKINVLHLHLSDDQGWRLMIESWPNLAACGGKTQVDGGPGGFYTQDEYEEIVAYAQSRYITVVPEIDAPGHTNAALASYPELNRDGRAPELYTGVKVGFSSLCIDKDITYKFLDDVIGELAALTPGPYIHIGGDEAMSTDKADYINFIERVQEIVRAHGKQTIGWEEIAQAKLLPTTVAQHWNTRPPYAGLPREAAAQGAKVIVSTASRLYMDIKYNRATEIGQNWAGFIEARDGYDWDPVSEAGGAPESAILGIEAAVWTETIRDMQDLEFMTLPRLPGYAEIGWSPSEGRNWDEYKNRLGAQGPRWASMGVDYYHSEQVPWD